MSRTIAILHDHKLMADNVIKIAKLFIDNDLADQVTIFTKDANNEYNFKSEKTNKSCQNACWPTECDNIPKIRNWINNYYKTQQFNGMLHVLEDTTDIIKDPTTFLNEIEHCMDVLDYNVWFSTVCDPCNYVYAKYNPRLGFVLDKVEHFKLELGKQLLFTSHSNTQWIIYDFSKVSVDLLRFDEDFTIAMFYIIEFLARRRNTKVGNQLYFMNQYLTVESEYGTFKNLKVESTDDNEKMKEEDQKFKEKNVNYSPDNNIDVVLETTYKKIKEKL